MRIISGKYRGLKLIPLEGLEIRPTADRVKESLFNILLNRVRLGRVLDLFGGSGNLGIEAISRGAEFVHINDVSPASIKVINSNLKKLKDGENFKVTNSDFSDCLNCCGKFDVIFIDPPYKHESGIRALEIIGEKQLLEGGGIAVYERDLPFGGEIKNLTIVDERKYGKTYLTFFGVSK